MHRTVRSAQRSVGTRNRRWGWFSSIVACFLLVVGSRAVAQGPPQPRVAGARIIVPERYRQAGRLKVATDAAYPPFEFIQDHRIQGFDVDLGNALGKELGLKMEWVNTAWVGVLPALASQKVDLIMSGMSIKPDRMRDRAFTRPYFLSGQAIARRRGDTKIGSVADLRQTGRAVAVQEGTTGDDAVVAARVPADQIKRFSDLPPALLDVQGGKADGVVADLPALKALIAKNYGELELVPGLVGDPELVGIAARKDDLVLVHALNEALDRLLVNGTYAEIYERWIGESPRAELMSRIDQQKTAGTMIPEAILRTSKTAATAAVAQDVSSRVPVRSALAIRPNEMVKALPDLLRAAGMTVKLTLLALLLGVPAGLFVALLRLSSVGVVRLVARWYVEAVRGTPLLLQIFVLYYVLGTPTVGVNLPPFWAGVAALSLNAAAYISEIFRAGIQSIDVGQMEAARSLGMTHGQSMGFVILPQTLRRVLPPLTNEAIALLKDTSLVSAITLFELTMQGRQLVNNGGSATTIYLGVALLYLAMTVPLTVLSHYLEARWQPMSRHRNPARPPM